MPPEVGDFVRVRDRRWLVERTDSFGDDLDTVTLAGPVSCSRC